MKYNIQTNGSNVTLHVSGQMIADDRDAFEGVIPKLFEAGAKTIVVNMRGLDYMDSAGLGMLLTLRDQASRRNISVGLAAPKGDVEEMLKLSCFDTLFNIGP